MTACTSAAVIGLGLIGGSVSRDLAARGVRVRAYDANADHLASALRDGVVHEALDWTLAGVAGAEVVVIAVPVDAAIEILGRLEPFTSDARLITLPNAVRNAWTSARLFGSPRPGIAMSKSSFSTPSSICVHSTALPPLAKSTIGVALVI